MLTWRHEMAVVMDQRCPQCLKTYGAEARFCAIDGTPLVALNTSDPVVGTKLDGRYLLTSRLGEGAMGVVYEGIQLSIERPVAIKLLHGVPGDSHRRRQRFWMEARSVSRLEHPNVVRIYDFGTTESDVPYLVMELLKGHVLREAMEAEDVPWSVRRSSQLICGVARGLAVAHSEGLVHRDIKPGNIWLTPSADGSAQDVVKVIDFGLVKDKALDSRMTRTGAVMGTPAYMAPEQIEGRQDIGPPVDVYALGVLLYQLIVGELPFGGDTYIELMTRHLSAPVPTPEQTLLGKPIPESLRTIWERALRKDPAERYADAQTMCDAITATGILDGPPQDLASKTPAISHSKSHGSLVELPTVQMGVSTVLQSLGTQSHLRKHVALLSVRVAEKPGEEAMDLEERLELLTPIFEDWRTVCENFGGHCTLNPGLGLRVIFGLPVAAQDDAERAMEAAMVIHERAQRGFQAGTLCVRIGLDTDSVLTQMRHGTFSVVGDPFDVPERAAAMGAPSGGLPVLTGAAYRRLRRSLRGELTTMTRADSEEVHQLASRDSFVSGEYVVEAPSFRMVGREPELHRVMTWIEETISKRGVEYHLVVGSTGVGKSRFLAGLESRLNQAHADVVVLRGGPDELREVPGSVLRSLLRRGTDSPKEDALLAMKHWVSQSLTQYASRVDSEVVSMILSLVGLEPIPTDVDPRNWRARAFRAMADFLGSLAIQGGLVLLIDDFDRIDTESLEILTSVMEELADFPVAIVGTGLPDPEFESQHPAVLQLLSLAQDQAELLMDRLDVDGLVSDLARRRIIAQAEGNPLFIEELVWAAKHDSFDESAGHFPDTLQGVLQARFDALVPLERTVLQMAAIVGSTFWTGAVLVQAELALVGEVEEVLVDLQSKGLIQTQESGLYRNDTEWLFAQPLMQEMAYASALKRERRRGHGAVVGWFESHGAHLPPAHYPLIARHCENAQRPSDAADAWRRAGAAASGRYANHEAIDNYERALGLQIDWDPDDVAQVQLEVGVLCFRVGSYESASSHLEEVLACTEAPPSTRIKAQRFMGRIAGITGDSAGQLELYAQALKEGEGGDLAERLKCVADYAFGLSRGADAHLAMPLIERELMALEDQSLSRAILAPLANLYLVKCILARDAGDLVLAEEAARAGLKASDEAESNMERAAILTSLSKCLRDKGEWEEAAQCAADAAKIFHLAGVSIHEVTALLNQGWFLLDGRQALVPNAIFVRIQELFASDLEASWALRVYYLAGASLAALGVGHLERAQTLADQVIEETDESLDTEYRGWALYAAGIVREDLTHLNQAVTLWKTLGRPLWVQRVEQAIKEQSPG